MSLRRVPMPATRSVTSRHWLWLVTGAGLLAGTVYSAPASWLGSALERLTKGRVLLLNTSGTLWQGKGDLVLSGGPDSASRMGLPGGIEWTVSPAWRSASVAIDLFAPCCTTAPLRGELSLNGSGLSITLRDHRSEWPAQWLSGLGTPWNMVRLSGQIQLQSQQLQLRSSPQGLEIEGQLQIDTPQLSSALSTLRPLGHYRLSLHGQPEGMQLDLKTLSGDLHISGNGQWSSRGMRFQGVAEALPERLNVLSYLLNILGRRDGPRAYISLGSHHAIPS